MSRSGAYATFYVGNLFFGIPIAIKSANAYLPGGRSMRLFPVKPGISKEHHIEILANLPYCESGIR